MSGTADLLVLTAKIVAAHLSRNHIALHTIPTLIESVHRTLTVVGLPKGAPVPQRPAVPVNRSVFPDYIVCLEDGVRLKMLKRYLSNTYGMTPEEYRAKWDLPKDYPMVAPNHSSYRSDLAKRIGLGRKPGG